MIGSFRQSMSWLHTWTGLVLGWILYFVFVTGSAGYFDTEIDRWMQPEINFKGTGGDQAAMLGLAEQRLKQVAPDAVEWFVNFPKSREPFLAVWWLTEGSPETGKKGEWHNEKIDLDSGEPIVTRETGGGQLLYRMHYRLHYIPTLIAYWLISLCSLFLLVVLISGVVIHKKIFKDFFTFRPGKKQRSWLDMHNVLSVLPLPFHLMITYSGLLLLMTVSMPLVIGGSYGFDEEGQQQFFEEVFAEDGAHASGMSAANITMSELMPMIESRWGQGSLGYISIENRGDQNAEIHAGKKGFDGIATAPTLVFSAVSGELQRVVNSEVELALAAKFYEVMTNLHEGVFAGPMLRWLYFLSGLMGAVMIATGMVLWVVKRREKSVKDEHGSRGLRLVEVLNIGTIIGLPIAIAAYFIANRLIPAGIPDRADVEVLVLFIVWGGSFLYPLLRRLPLKRKALTGMRCAWVELLWLAAASYVFVPVLNLLTTDKHLINSITQGDWAMAGFDLTLMVFGGVFAIAALKVREIKNEVDQYTKELASNGSQGVVQ